MAVGTKKQEGIVFQHFYRNATYTLRPASRSIVNGIPQNNPALRAVFDNHRFDSGRVQKALGWTDEDRRLVEQYLMDHPDFGSPRGMSIEAHTIESLKDSPVRIPALQVRCAAFYRDAETGESVQCERQPKDGEDFCVEHLAEIRLAQEAPAEEALPVPDADLSFLDDEYVPEEEEEG